MQVKKSQSLIILSSDVKVEPIYFEYGVLFRIPQCIILEFPNTISQW